MTTAEAIVKLAKSKVGVKEFSAGHLEILRTYNNQKNLPRHYPVKSTDEWCATFVSYLFVKTRSEKLIGGGECSVERLIWRMKDAKIWNENGSIRPAVGDIICYNWNDGTQPNDGWADHVGIVYKIVGRFILIIEGNMSNGAVGIRRIPVGWGYIRGYGHPKYAKPSKRPIATDSKIKKAARDVINGKYGNGRVRKLYLKRAGFSESEIVKIQNEVNRLCGM